MELAYELVFLYTRSYKTIKDMDKETIIGFDALYESAFKCKSNVMWKDSVANHIHNCVQVTARLTRELEEGTYKERAPKFFTIYEPKQREIMSINFRDRVYQRSLNDNAVYPQATKGLIYDNLACQKDKGTDRARGRLKCHLQRHYRKHGLNGYVLQCDIKGYYPNMSHKCVKEMFGKRLEPEPYEMAVKVIDTYPSEIGFNPGSQMIQIAGIAVLDDLDHFIKERLRVKHYLRYMDDMVLLAKTKEEAEAWKEAIESELGKIGFELHEKKTRIYPNSKPIRFLGFDFRLTNTGKVLMFLNPDNVKKRRKKLIRMANKAKRGEIPKSKVYECYTSWRNHASRGDSTQLLLRMDKEFKEMMK